MDATPWLRQVAQALAEVELEAVLIGNAAAALQGAPLTTVDFDFFFRRTPRNVRKLKELAGRLGAVLWQPYYPISGLFRMTRDDDSLQLDFMSVIHGAKSFEGVRRRADWIEVGGAKLLVASLADVVRSKEAASRPRDLAVLDILKKTLDETEGASKKGARGAQGRK